MLKFPVVFFVCLYQDSNKMQTLQLLNFSFVFNFYVFIYFKGRETEGNTHRDLLSNGSLPHMPTTAGVGPSGSQEPGTSSRSPTQMTATQLLQPSPSRKGILGYCYISRKLVKTGTKTQKQSPLLDV